MFAEEFMGVGPSNRGANAPVDCPIDTGFPPSTSPFSFPSRLRAPARVKEPQRAVPYGSIQIHTSPSKSDGA